MRNKLRVIIAFIIFGFVSVFSAVLILVAGIVFMSDIVNESLSNSDVVEVSACKSYSDELIMRDLC